MMRFLNLDTALYPQTWHLVCSWYTGAGRGGRGSRLQRSSWVNQAQCSRDRLSILVTIWKIYTYWGTWLFWWNIAMEVSDVRQLSAHHLIFLSRSAHTWKRIEILGWLTEQGFRVVTEVEAQAEVIEPDRSQQQPKTYFSK